LDCVTAPPAGAPDEQERPRKGCREIADQEWRQGGFAAVTLKTAVPVDGFANPPGQLDLATAIPRLIPEAFVIRLSGDHSIGKEFRSAT
jgi:hypothetical protein